VLVNKLYMLVVKAVERSAATVCGQGDSIPVARYQELGMRMGFHCVYQVLVACCAGVVVCCGHCHVDINDV